MCARVLSFYLALLALYAYNAVLKDVQEVNHAFESENADHIKLFDDLFRLLKSLTNIIIIPCNTFDYIEGDIDSMINEYVYLGYNFEKSCKDLNVSAADKKQSNLNW